MDQRIENALKLGDGITQNGDGIKRGKKCIICLNIVQRCV